MRHHPISISGRLAQAIHATIPRVRPVSRPENHPEPAPKPALPHPQRMRVNHQAIAASVTDQILSTRDPETGWITGLWEQPGKQRLYQVDLCQDLFGEWLQVDTWWRKSTAFGGCKKTYLGFDVSPEKMRELFRAAALRRSRHKYQVIDWRSFRFNNIINNEDSQ
ncbi:hypothetical protein B1757_02545 [Acidithiobacillus marinus]|uniref:WGR domain-containing protein n=1 Tax=Acidithiobacillus marinus TaxID=187490 RepID=A0A2I1DPQ9_9PROT|nr:hypothetical protein [Acidithiobacillus marinus]PKY11857.1 hypothetical protein B1757_02545 [Acidithiobacillus marinus]